MTQVKRNCLNLIAIKANYLCSAQASIFSMCWGCQRHLLCPLHRPSPYFSCNNSGIWRKNHKQILMTCFWCSSGVSSIKKTWNCKCSLQVWPLFLEIDTNLNSIEVSVSSRCKPPPCNDIFRVNVHMHSLQLLKRALVASLLNWPPKNAILGGESVSSACKWLACNR